MDPRLTDPHNHVPEVTPDDVWGDTDTLNPRFPGGATVLPPKRAKADAPARAKAGRAEEGIRIESRALPRSVEDSQLEVQEIDGTVLRLDPEVPAVAKVPRQTTFRERPARPPSEQGEDKNWGRARKTSLRWLLGTGVGVGALVVLPMLLLPMVNKSNAERPLPGQLVIAPKAEENARESEVLNDMLLRQPEAEQVFRIYARSTVTDDFLPWLRHEESVRELVRAHPRPALVGKDWLPGDDTAWNVFRAEGLCFGVIEGSLPDYSRFRAYMTLEKGQLRLDWKATNAYGTATFDELAKGTGNPAEIRAHAAISGFYTLHFPEPDWQCYQLVSANGEDIIWAYTRRGGEPDAQIGALFKSGHILAASQDPKRVTLRLGRGPDGSLPNQWVVEEMLHKDWITP